MRPCVHSLAVLVVGAAALAGGDASRNALAVEGAIQNADNGHWYLYVASTSHVYWDACNTSAQALGGYLATITSSAEGQWISSNLMSGRPKTYLGGSDAASEGSWQWVTSETWSYTNWSSGQPSDPGTNTPPYTSGQDYVQLGGPYGAAWDDVDGGFVDTDVYGYVVEWDTDPDGPGVVPPPQAPTQLVASYSESDGVTLTWNDNSTDETGFGVERRPAGYSYAHLASKAADATSHVDGLLYPSTTYTYRVRAYNSGGASAWSNEASITTAAGQSIPAVPRSPTQLTAVAGADPVIDLAWTDNSVDETFFDLERSPGGAEFRTAERLTSDVVAFADAPVHPGWPYVYRVRALALQGPSPWSNTAGAVTAPTLDVAVTSGTITDSRKRKGDKIKVTATLAFLSQAVGATLDPVAHGLELHLGSANVPVTVSIAPGDPTWKLRRGKATWKSPRGMAPKVTVTLDTTRHLLTASVSGADFAEAPASTVRLLVACGADGGAHAATWTERRPGALRFE